MGCETKEDIKKLAKLKKDLANDPGSINLLLKIGMLLFDPFMEVDTAIKYLKKAIQLSPNNPDALFWTGYVLYHGMWKYDEAKKLFEKALTISPNREEVHYMLFYVLWYMTDNDKTGIKHLLRAIELQPEWISPRIQYIIYLSDRNKLKEAETELSTAYSVLKEQQKNKKETGANILEQYYLDNSGGIDYEFTKKQLDEKKKEIIRKKNNGT